jgi:hypothetical protein
MSVRVGAVVLSDEAHARTPCAYCPRIKKSLHVWRCDSCHAAYAHIGCIFSALEPPMESQGELRRPNAECGSVVSHKDREFIILRQMDSRVKDLQDHLDAGTVTPQSTSTRTSDTCLLLEISQRCSGGRQPLGHLLRILTRATGGTTRRRSSYGGQRR